MIRETLFVPAPREPIAGEVGVIGGRAEEWEAPTPPEDEGFEPTIVRGRE